MSEPVFDYLNPPPLPKVALTPGSTPSDTAGVVEILKLVTDPAAHKKHLAERQQIAAEKADLARQWAELRRAKLAQEEELKRLRQEFAAALEIDRSNHIAKLQAEKDDWAAAIAKLLDSLHRIDRGEE